MLRKMYKIWVRSDKSKTFEMSTKNNEDGSFVHNKGAVPIFLRHSGINKFIFSATIIHFRLDSMIYGGFKDLDHKYFHKIARYVLRFMNRTETRIRLGHRLRNTLCTEATLNALERKRKHLRYLYEIKPFVTKKHVAAYLL